MIVLEAGYRQDVRRWQIGLSALALAVGGGLVGALLARSHQSRPVTTTRFEVMNGSRSAALTPAPIPTLLEGASDPRQLVLGDAVPSDATLVSADYVTLWPQQLVVTWERAHLTRTGDAAIWQRRGVAVWQLDRAGGAEWHRVYTHEVKIDNITGVQGFEVTLGDASGDGRPEILILFATDGSAGGGTYHLLANTGQRLREALVMQLSLDQGTMSFAHHALVVLSGRDGNGRSIHCCFRRVQETWARWDGGRMVTVRRVVRTNRRGWPPG
jgi:hypothetical protein